MAAASPEDLAELCLRLGDDRLVLGHRLSEWIGHAPVLEEELAIGNLALDLLGQASDLLAHAGELQAEGRSADDLAFFRDVTGFRNALLVEQPNDDFAVTIVRQLLFDAWNLHLSSALETSPDAWLARFGSR
ncbi:MAG: 1,2-phenylacetyl-CoA epoxidase subunit PaaC, partial [Candidatus Binatia bacterium]